MKCLYVFVDESGNLDFKISGTNYFVLAAVSALAPLNSSLTLQNLKYEFLTQNSGGRDYQHFHASEDRQIIRDKVFSCIDTLHQNIHVNYIIAEKRKTHPSYHNANFYGLLGSALIKYLLKIHQSSPYQKVIIIFDQALTNKEENNFLKAAKPLLKEIGVPYAIYFHRTMSDFNGQIADYCAWAKYVSLERNEQRPLSQIQSVPQDTFDIFRNGTTYYY
ncbi:MAG: hypothetical protein RLZZ70_600 [Candidatus Parcubacteria bacterium]